LASPDSLLKVSLDELRMQMLGTQVAFGFQFQSLFQDRLDLERPSIQLAACIGLGFIVLTLGLLIAAPAIHRIAESGAATERMRRFTARAARAALLTLSVSLAAALFVAVETELGLRAAWIAAIVAAFVTVAAWQAWGVLLRRRSARRTGVHDVQGKLHDRIDYTLTESRVILPGAQALFGFQLIVILTKPFATLPDHARIAHLAALSCIALAIVLLIAPAAIHRIAFNGDDDERFLRIASRILTLALVPLSVGISTELYVAATRLLPGTAAPSWTAAIGLCLLLSLWYVVPLALRKSAR
jgi:uncharacterized protein DUF6328